jgi:hypothetical protein
MFRKIFSLCALLVAMTCAAFAQEQTWTGKISDSKCGAKHMTVKEHKTEGMEDGDCVAKCAGEGARYVFVYKGKVYDIENQDLAGLVGQGGKTVKLTGVMSGSSIKATKVE